jgi:hypothetical protein
MQRTKTLADWERVKGCFPKFLSAAELEEIAQALYDHQMSPYYWGGFPVEDADEVRSQFAEALSVFWSY